MRLTREPATGVEGNHIRHGSHFQKTQTGYTRSSALSILSAAPHNRGSGALEAGGLEPASPGTASTRRITMRHTLSRTVPPRAR